MRITHMFKRERDTLDVVIYVLLTLYNGFWLICKHCNAQGYTYLVVVYIYVCMYICIHMCMYIYLVEHNWYRIAFVYFFVARPTTCEYVCVFTYLNLCMRACVLHRWTIRCKTNQLRVYKIHDHVFIYLFVHACALSVYE